MKELERITWQERAKRTEEFHNATGNKVEQTADTLHCSVSHIRQQLKLARGMRVYPEIADFLTAIEALRYLDKKRKVRHGLGKAS